MRTWPATLPAVVLATTVLLVITGCGSTSSTIASRSGSVATTATTASTTTSASVKPVAATPLTGRIEAICVQQNRALAAVTTAIGSESELRHVFAKRARVEQDTLNQLAKVTVPGSMQPGWSQLINHLHALINAEHNLAQHGTRGRTGRAIDTVGQTQKETLATAKQLGLTRCAQES